jgi:hypothetical protein
MPFASQPTAQPLTRLGKRRLVLIGVILVAALAAGIAWAAISSGSYDSSRAGCVTVTVPSSTGGALLHECGAGARALCRNAFARSDRFSVLARPQCRLAGLAAKGQGPVQ